MFSTYFSPIARSAFGSDFVPILWFDLNRDEDLFNQTFFLESDP
jgi:hypothetical protein